MANLDYYAHEVDALLRQVNVNRNDIGMTQVNILPVPDGEWETNYKSIPSTMELSVSGDKLNGVITVSVDGTAPNSEPGPYAQYNRDLTPHAAADSIGIIKPGTYLLSLGGSDSVADMPWQLPGTDTWYPRIEADVYHDNTWDEYKTKCFGEPAEVVVPENFTSVTIKLYLNFDYFTDVSASCELFPFLRLKELQDEPFEPYKPDLQTQITELTARVEALERGGGGGGVTLITRSFDSNGTYDAADDNADGYYRVDVDVPEDPDYNETQTDAVTDAVEEVTQ